MRILFSTNHSYLPQRVGGAASSTHDLCSQFISMNHQVSVLAALKSNDSIWLRNRLAAILTPWRKVSTDHVMGYPVFRASRPGEHIAWVVETFQPEIAIINAGAPLSSAMHFLQCGVPTAIYLRDVEFQHLGGNSLDQQQIFYLANSRFTATCFKERFGLDSMVVPPIVRPEQYSVKSNREAVLFINPVPQKGVDIAIRIAAQTPEIPFIFVEGWPKTPAYYLNLKKKLAVLKNVRLQSRVLDMRQVYQHAKILLAPSCWQEGWGRVATEAQINGIPVLASNRGGLPEAVGPGGKILSPDDDISVWVDELRKMWNDHAYYQRLSEAAFQHAARDQIAPHFLASMLIDQISRHLQRQG